MPRRSRAAEALRARTGPLGDAPRRLAATSEAQSGGSRAGALEREPSGRGAAEAWDPEAARAPPPARQLRAGTRGPLPRRGLRHSHPPHATPTARRHTHAGPAAGCRRPGSANTRLERLASEPLGSPPDPGAAPARAVPASGTLSPLGALGRCHDLGKEDTRLSLSLPFSCPFLPSVFVSFFLNFLAAKRRPCTFHLSQKKLVSALELLVK